MNDSTDKSTDKEKWNQRYAAASSEIAQQSAAQVLLDYQHLLPQKGDALDMACGLGSNALLLAQQGLSVTAWDISDAAIALLQQLIDKSADAQHKKINAEVRDVQLNPPPVQHFDVIVVSRFLERALFPALIHAIRPDGLLFYQTFIKDKPEGVGPGNPDYLLAENELLNLCSGMRILAYREEGQVGDCSRGFRNEAMIVAQRRQ